MNAMSAINAVIGTGTPSLCADFLTSDRLVVDLAVLSSCCSFSIFAVASRN